MEETITKSTVAKDETLMCREPQLRPLGCGWQPSLLYNQHFGLPPFMDFRDLSWMEGIFRKLHTSSWPGYSQAPGFAQLSPKMHREVGGGISEVTTQQNKWTVTLDVNHFAPADITVRIQSGFLEIEGKHNERQDEHGYISRFFLRKYKLPAGVEVQSLRTCITGDGVLTIEAALPDVATLGDVTIPIQVEIDSLVLKDQYQDGAHPGVAGTVDGVGLTRAGKPDGAISGPDKKFLKTSSLADAAGSVEGKDAMGSQQDGDMTEKQKLSVAASSAAKIEVLDSKSDAPQVPQAHGTVMSEKEFAIQAKKEKEQIQAAGMEGGLLSYKAGGQLSATQDEIPIKSIKRAEMQVAHVK